LVPGTELGKLVHAIRKKSVGPFGIHGRVSAAVQNGRMVLLSKDKLLFSRRAE